MIDLVILGFPALIALALALDFVWLGKGALLKPVIIVGAIAQVLWLVIVIQIIGAGV